VKGSWVEYTKQYDAIVGAVKDDFPDMEWIGIVAEQLGSPEFYTYFLNNTNHAKDIPISWVSFHFYGGAGNATLGKDLEEMFRDFDSAFITIQNIKLIRDKLNPTVKLALDEFGVMSAPGTLSDLYWVACGSYYAYGFTKLGVLGIDAVHSSQLLGYPSQYPDVTMVDWVTGKGNARYWSLKLIIDTIDVGKDTFVETLLSYSEDIFAQAVIKENGDKLILLGSKRGIPLTVKIAGGMGATFEYIDITTGSGPAKKKLLSTDTLTLSAFG